MSIILTDFPQIKSASGKLLSRYSYKLEEELQREVSKHFKDVFGERAKSFEKTIRLSIPGIDRKAIPDDFALDLTDPQKPKLLLIEYELSIHDVYEHISTQIMKFLNAFKANQLTIFESLRKNCKSESEQLKLHDAIFKSLPRTIVVIDQATEEIKEVADRFDVRLLEFTSYVEDTNRGLKSEHVHIFEPYYKLEVEKPRRRKELPEHRRDWEARLKWVTPELRGLFNQLTKRIEGEFRVVEHAPMYRWYAFYSSKDISAKSRFLVLMAKKKKFSVRIPVYPKKFQDERRWTKPYKGWFFYPTKARPEVEEREFTIKRPEGIKYAMKLIKQSYDFSLEA